jgi:hypothetical protein
LAVAAGVKVIEILQLDPAARVAPQLVVSAKSPGLVPARVMPEIFSTALPVLESVVIRAAEAVPAVVAGKLSAAGDSDATGAGAAVPSPVNVTIWGDPAALSATEIVAA